MAKKYIINCHGKAVEITKPNSMIQICKMPYKDVVAKKYSAIIQNPFIVYILHGINESGKDMIYVGKSKNGIANRPQAHSDKYDNWSTCYVLTQFKERTFFNDGTIQYLENEINQRIDELKCFENTTRQTTTGTANSYDMEDCDDYLEEAYKMLYVLGLDFITNSEEDQAASDIENSTSFVEARKKVPNGTYTLVRKIKKLNGATIHAIMEVRDGKFILKAGSEISSVTNGISTLIENVRNAADIDNGVLQEDIEFYSPSACGELATGAPCNGWIYWKDGDGNAIDKYRSNS